MDLPITFTGHALWLAIEFMWCKPSQIQFKAWHKKKKKINSNSNYDLTFSWWSQFFGFMSHKSSTPILASNLFGIRFQLWLRILITYIYIEETIYLLIRFIELLVRFPLGLCLLVKKGIIWWFWIFVIMMILSPYLF